MADLPSNGNITADGDYDIVVNGGIRYNVNIGGDFGGGTVIVSEENAAKTTIFSPVATMSAITSNFTDVLKTRDGQKVRFSLSGSTSPDLYIHIVALRNG